MNTADKVKTAWNDIIDNGVSNDYFNEQAEKGEEDSTIMIVQKLIDTLEQGEDN